MLLIHGVGMRADYWINIEPQLARHFSLTVIDMPGHANSPRLEADHPDLADYTDQISAVLSDARPAIVVGHSMGALIALDLAVRYKKKVSGIAVLNGVYRRTSEALAAINARVAELTQAISTDSAPVTDPAATLERWFGAAPEGINADASKACRVWLNAADPIGYRDAYRAFARADAPTDQQLTKVTCQALFMTGSLEPNSTPEMSQRMSQLVPGSRCYIVEGARHMMSMTHGDQVVQALTRCFLPGHSVKTGGVV